MPSIFRIFGAVGCAVVLSSNAGAQGLVSQKNIPLAMAKTIAEAAMDKCKELGFKVSVRRWCWSAHAGRGGSQSLHRADVRHLVDGFRQADAERPGLGRLQGIQPCACDLRRSADQGRR